MTMQSFFGRYMLQADLGASYDLLKRKFVPRVRWRTIYRASIVDPPEIVVVSVGVQGDLLLYGESAY